MSHRWPNIRLGEVLSRIDTSIPTSQLIEIRLAGVYSFGRGLFARGLLSPANTTYKSYNKLVVDDFVISQPKAWEGALARVTPEFEGCFLSPVFPTFRADRDRLEPTYLEWFCRRRAVWGELQHRSRGIGARRESVSSGQFLSLEIPLPPLKEQKCVVARIERLAAKIEEARTLRQQAAAEAEALCRAILMGDPHLVLTPMSSLVRLRPPDVDVRPDETYQFAGVYCFGRGVFRGRAVSGLAFAYPRLTRLRVGDFVYPKLMAWEGAFGTVPQECDGCVVSPEFPVFEVFTQKVFAEVLDTHFRSPTVWPAISGASTGTNVRRRRLNARDFLNYQFPLPSRATQDRIRAVRKHMDTLRPLQADTAAGFGELLPRVLDGVFKGEL